MATSSTRGRPRSFDRDVALDQAIRLFWRNGYEATSIRDLSEALGIGTPSLYNAFGDKQALFTEAVGVYDREYGEFIEAALAEEPTAAAAIARILSEAPARYTRRGLPAGCLVVSGDAGCTDATIRRSLQRLRSHKTRLLTDKINADIATGQLPEDTDAAGWAGYVMVVLSGMAQRAQDGATRSELTKIAQIASDTGRMG
ncbi:TetR/AcrR family transcriptional regulator [Micromonospora sp. NPDC048830]|uniref:TetR/AcrR family transcriptional regulator n=1 Tax=Micromonospora sp. NPDC048830 TaxID=3364257 RepID=UPI0037175FCD